MSRNFTSDQELIDRLLLNDTDAFEELYRRYWYSLYTYSLKKLKSSDAARQIVKSIFIDLWENRQNWSVNFSVSSHLYTEVRKSVVKCLNDKLINDSYNEMIEQQITAGFSVSALQTARQPVQQKAQMDTASEVLRQHTLDTKDSKHHLANLANMKWLYHLISAKLD